MKSMFILALLAAPAFAQDALLGPSGVPSVEPFPLITEEYEADYKSASLCKGAPKAGGQVFEGKKAVYYKPLKGDVDVLTDEYGRRFALDYCWI